MKNMFFALALVIGFSTQVMAGTVQFEACAAYNKDSKVLISIKDDKAIDLTVYYLTETGQPTQAVINTQVSNSAAITTADLTTDVTTFLTKYGVEDVTGGTSYAASVTANDNFIFDVLNQKGTNKAVLVTYNGNFVFIGSSANCK